MLYLLKPGELMLKKGNRRYFERALSRSIRQSFPGCSVRQRSGRVYVSGDYSPDCFAERLGSLPGISGFAPVYTGAKDRDSIAALVRRQAARQVARYGPESSFRLRVRRIDKSLDLDSQAYAVWLGDLIRADFPSLKVRLKGADWCLNIELREKTYVYSAEKKGLGGLPRGTSGRGMLLLSGGIDSPVAGYLLACRGMSLEAVYFDTPPFTTAAAYDKVQRLASRLARWTHSNGLDTPDQSLLLHRVPFTELQLALRKHGDPAALVLQSRACMVQLAEHLARQQGCETLVSGEALSQVASQTIENLAYTNRFAQMPILRPLIGFDKEQIIRLSRQIACFDISVEPHVDCCSYFAPEHPVTKANILSLETELGQVPDLPNLLNKTLAAVETLKIGPHWDIPR
ncbi:MAG: tRNA uracil 4-sulfurtransferase ThiI [Spirochaetota bacterium]